MLYDNLMSSSEQRPTNVSRFIHPVTSLTLNRLQSLMLDVKQANKKPGWFFVFKAQNSRPSGPEFESGSYCMPDGCYDYTLSHALKILHRLNIFNSQT